MTTTQDDHHFYREAGRLSSAGEHAARLSELPDSLHELVGLGHGRMIHEHLAAQYDVELTDEHRASVHIRHIEPLLDQMLDTGPPLTPRPPAERIAGNCRHFTLLLVAILRAKDIPARARCGFGNYFGRHDFFDDHWVCEYWDATSGAWRLVDAQIDAKQHELFGIDFDVSDVPRDRFVIAGDAWTRHRNGEVDANRYGLQFLGEGGDWWIAGNLMRDVAALNNMEMLPWDAWGVMPEPDRPIDETLAVRFDRLATLTTNPDGDFDELRRSYREPGLTVPDKVYNVLRERDEVV